MDTKFFTDNQENFTARHLEEGTEKWGPEASASPASP